MESNCPDWAPKNIFYTEQNINLLIAIILGLKYKQLNMSDISKNNSTKNNKIIKKGKTLGGILAGVGGIVSALAGIAMGIVKIAETLNTDKNNKYNIGN